ncbi:hypothetical protein DFP72DRAFT_987053 [Ephemerocybe angulata]|uniref:Uncharacterized protein n=1 Tax=Ephemerocybe angulata TaxID=980116 RepID=A0A8H6MBQ8_9AGAR|nr:hypothetical protein DFP72DRAFT_987053 [Tulosesus angulatus]
MGEPATGGAGSADPVIPVPQVPVIVPDTVWTKVGPPAEAYDTDDKRRDTIPILPPAYTRKEHPGIRIAYLQAVIRNLSTTLKVLETTGILPPMPAPVHTVTSAKCCLGVDPDEHIIQYVLYERPPLAFLPYPNCDGIIYKEERDANQKVKQTALNISPQVSLIHSLHRIIHRKGRGTPKNKNNDPQFVMKDMHDGKQWHDMKTGIKHEVGNHGAVRDVEVKEGSEECLTDHRFGLHLTTNTDWFGALENWPHSCGPVYIAIADLPWDQRFLQVNVICTGITHGPKELTTEQMVNVMEPVLHDMERLKNAHFIFKALKWTCTTMTVRQSSQKKVYADFICNNCDTPGTRKFAGFSGHTADFHPCPWCNCMMLDVNKQSGYVPTSFTLKDDPDLLRQKFRSKDAGVDRQVDIASRYGVRFSAFDWLPGWKPAKQTPLDFMHCVFLGIVTWLFGRILVGAHMFGGLGGDDSPKMRFEQSLNSRWPSHITCLLKNLGHNQSVKKADEWRQLITVAPVILWMTWRDADNSIPDTEPQLAPNKKISTTHTQKQCSLYEVILYLCAAVWMLSMKTISMAQAAVGQQYLLSINHHLAMHFEPMIWLFGPVYAWWLFVYEHFNGMLEKVQTHLIYELFLSLPEDASPYERELLGCIIKAEGQGSMLHNITVFQSEESVNSVRLPKRLPKHPISVHHYSIPGTPLDNVDLYSLLYHHACAVWPAIRFRCEFSNEEGLTFIGNKVVHRLPYIKKDGIRYGSMANHRTQTDTFAFIMQDLLRVPIQILDCFLLEIPPQDGQALHHACVLARRLKLDERVPALLWDLFASILGIHASYADEFHDVEILSASALDSPLALIPVKHYTMKRDLWISVLLDHVAMELEEVFDEDI